MLDCHNINPSKSSILISSRKLSATGVMLDFDLSRSRSPRLSVWPSASEAGSPVLWQREDEFLVARIGHCQILGQETDLFSGAWLRRTFERPELLSELSGVFALFIVDEVKREALVATGRMGVQPVYKREDARGRVCFCTHLSWL